MSEISAPPDPGRDWPRKLLFIVATMLSAALLFSVEPMITKMVLPRFGGSAAVWSVAIAFFQGALLVGYLYAHWLVRIVPFRAGVLIHLAVLAGAGAVLPLAIADPAPVGASQPARLLLVFAATVGLPFAALSANAPLLQAWFAASSLRGNRNPYPLYAASNLGSFAALLAYPLVVEPGLRLSAQSGLWAGGYVLLIALIAAAGLTAGLGRGRLEAPTRFDWAQGPGWLILAAIPSAGLVAVTAHLSTDVAAAPFLWVVPLALYLLTFVVAFGAFHLNLPLIRAAAAAGVVVLAVLVGFGLRLGLVTDLALHLTGFAMLALACHAVLASRRPPAEGLTGFYLALSAGGLLGGLGAALVAPAVFSFVAEYPLVLIAGAAVVTPRRWRWGTTGLVAAVVVLGHVAPWKVGSREMHRSFFGLHTLDVTADGQYRILRHGLEIHGVQRLRDAAGQLLTGKPKPLAFYHEDSPISEAIDAAREARGGGAIRVGVVGLGTGSIACLAETMDTVEFYEIDPTVAAIARDPAKFSFLSACAPTARIIEGDARQTLGADAALYDILIIDAFSSDSIPLHLLTQEAFETYLRRTAPGGMVLLHISNDHLRLNDIVAATARALGLTVLINDEEADPAATAAYLFQPAVAVLARQTGDFGALGRSDDWVAPEARGDIHAWTDDYFNLLAAVRDRLRHR